MLVLSRRLREKIVFPGFNASVQVVEVKRGMVRLGIEAPPEVTILRGELQEQTAAGSAAAPAPAAAQRDDPFYRQLCDRLKGTGMGLGLLGLQLEVGRTEEAKATLANLREEFQLLLHGVAGELEQTPRETAKPRRKAPRALLVEDDSSQRELLAAFLRVSGVEVDTVGDGSDALEYLHRVGGKPDVVLCDMMLPRCDGPTMVRTIRQDSAFAGLKIFGVTGYAPEDFGLASGPTGIDRWFRKPVDPGVLLQDLTREVDAALCGL